MKLVMEWYQLTMELVIVMTSITIEHNLEIKTLS